ncbi:MAG: hypothetical protein ACKOWG_19860 [Planctomycetia bacterium]
MPLPAMLSTDPLSRLLDVLQPSLAMYLGDSGIWSYPGREAIKLALADLVGDHRSLVGRAAAELEDRGIAPSPSAYPITFTGCHDVDIRSLLPRVMAGLRGQVAALDALVDASGDDSVANELAREAKASSLGHIDALEQVMKAAS